MSVITGEDDLEVVGSLTVTAPATFNTSNLAGTGTSDPTAGTTTLFYDTETDLPSYRNTLTSGVIALAPFDRRFGYFTGIDTVVVINSATNVELTWSTLSLSNGGVVSLTGGGRISLDSVGLYDIRIDACYEGASAQRCTLRTQLSDDAGSTIIPFSSIYHYFRQTANGESTGSANMIYNNTSIGTELTVFASRLTGNATCNALADSYRAIITKISVS